MSNGARTATIVAGLGSIALGAVANDSAGVDSDGNGSNDNPFNDDHGQQALGSVMIIGGVIMFIAGIASHPPAAPPPPPLESSVPVGARDLPGGRVSDNVLRLARQMRSLAARHECAAAATLVARIAAEDPAYAAELRVAMPCHGTPTRPVVP
ncbi:MAG: hypothetical protein IPH44_29025 [Myxococcales bacterium]|nr:hypothetical protein [Myxococcales bacterium]MBK7191344.1 hypothetical protein [Myxococcales bacterium]MBP6845232.1 hypothetical protein [Kofleriaceae bacterium]